MDHLLRRGASVPPLQNITRTKARKSYNGFPAIPRQLTMHQTQHRTFLLSKAYFFTQFLTVLSIGVAVLNATFMANLAYGAVTIPEILEAGFKHAFFVAVVMALVGFVLAMSARNAKDVRDAGD